MPNQQERFFNCHAHCFTDDHVPEYFLSKFLPISKLLSNKSFVRFLHKSAFSNDIGLTGRLLVFILHLFDKNITKDLVLRYMNFFVYDDVKTQEDVIKEMQKYYPFTTGLVMLTMDMEYMGAGKPKALLEKQLQELAEVKAKMNDIVYPFIHCDPRRIEPLLDREKAVEQNFIGAEFLNTAFKYLQDKIYQGIKIYPALGYYPFDERMKPVYDFALKNNLPITTHCIVGAVHFKYKLSEKERYHPFLKKTFPEQPSMDYQYNFTHPLNYECLLNKDLLKTVWKEAPDYSELKICLAHWGGESEWREYIENAWSDLQYKHHDKTTPELDFSNWVTDSANSKFKNFSWFSIICSLINSKKYPNLYVDISYTLEDATLLPLLKMTLESNQLIRERVLFGTDFFLVSKSISERKFGIDVRSYIGDELFDQISRINALRFLSTELNPVYE